MVRSQNCSASSRPRKPLPSGLVGPIPIGSSIVDVRGHQREPALLVLGLDVAPRALCGDQRGMDVDLMGAPPSIAVRASPIARRRRARLLRWPCGSGRGRCSRPRRVAPARGPGEHRRGGVGLELPARMIESAATARARRARAAARRRAAAIRSISTPVFTDDAERSSRPCARPAVSARPRARCRRALEHRDAAAALGQELGELDRGEIRADDRDARAQRHPQARRRRELRGREQRPAGRQQLAQPRAGDDVPLVVAGDLGRHDAAARRHHHGVGGEPATASASSARPRCTSMPRRAISPRRKSRKGSFSACTAAAIASAPPRWARAR